MGTVEISLDEYRRLIQRDMILALIEQDAKELLYMNVDDILKYFGTSKAKLAKQAAQNEAQAAQDDEEDDW